LAFSSPTQPLALPHLDGVRHSAVNARGIRFHLAEAGDPDGEPVFVIHGWPQHWLEWRDLLGAPPAGLRILAPDLPGYGWSSPPPHRWSVDDLALDLLALLDVLEIPGALLVGHDWGGLAAYALALEAPERFRALLAIGIVNPWVAYRTLLRHVWRLTVYQLPIIVAGTHLFQHTNFVRTVIRHWGPNGQVMSDEVEASFVDSFRAPAVARTARSSYRTIWREAPRRMREPELRSLELPTRVLHGADDRCIHRALADPGPGHADDLRVTYVEGCGHFIADERPELVRDALVELDRTTR
jgi:pimeloyl-ACP methyl ester carboxylesterase